MLSKYINSFFKKNRCFILAYDQGLGKPTSIFKNQSQNPLYIYNLAKTINATGIVLNKGVAEIFYSNSWNQVPIILKLDFKHHSQESIIQTCSVNYAKMIGAKAIGYTIYFGSNFEQEQIKNFATIAEEAHKLKMGVVLWAYTVEKDFSICQDNEKIKNNTRTAFELGADLIKMQNINNPKDIAIIKAIAPNLPIGIRGGELTNKENILNYIQDAIDNQADGFIIGRNIWQNDDPIAIGQKIHNIIFK